ncbi:hypothetical protein ABW19_dt0209787 [Dactylella cylindrospora]|nr:hypothetical protein ABW19_dt0209787 [Dactylella cylindrospora]
MAYDAARQYEAPRRAYMQQEGPNYNNQQYAPQSDSDPYREYGNGASSGNHNMGLKNQPYQQNYQQNPPPPRNNYQQPYSAASGGGGANWDGYGNNSSNNGYSGYDDSGVNADFGNLSIQNTGPQRNNYPSYEGPSNYQSNPNAVHPPRTHSANALNQAPRYDNAPNRNGNFGPPAPQGRNPNGPPQRGPPPQQFGERPGTADGWQTRQGPPPQGQRRPPPPQMNQNGPRPRNGPPGGPGGTGGPRGPPPPNNQGPMQFHRPRPPPESNSYQGQNGGWSGRPGPPQGPDGYGRGGMKPLSDAGRSQTMPAHVNPGNGEFQGPGAYRGNQNVDFGDQSYPSQDGYYGYADQNPRNRGFDPTRGSVGDVLDLYTYDDSYGTNPRSNSLSNNFHYDNGGGFPQNPPQQQQQSRQEPGGGGFGSQAHRSRSQPNLRGDGPAYGPTSGGYPEFAPPMPQFQNSGNWNSGAPGGGPPNAANQINPQNPNPSSYGNMAPNARSGSGGTGALIPDNASVKSSLSTTRPPPQRSYPSQTPSDPARSNSFSLSTGTGTPMASSSNSLSTPGIEDPDALPEHPAPVRPGLSGDGAPNRSGQSQNPGAPQVNPLVAEGKMSIHDIGPVTFDMLNLMRNEIASKPANQPVNPSLQLRFAKRLVEASFVLVTDSDSKAARKSRENFTLEAHRIVKKLSTGTHPYPDAMFYLANCYGDGSLGLEVDHDRAFSLYQSAAKMNHAPSAYRTAVCCEIGAGTKKEPQKAIQWYRKAATIGDTAAMYKIGIILLKGLLGQPRNDRDAIVWLKRAAEQADEENPHALHQLGLLYESADGNSSIVRDLGYARELFTRAAELGYPPSQYRLGTAYAYGLIGCPVDAKLSITWYSRAAANGDAESELALAGWYLTGAEGILEQNDTEAYLWSRKAAEKGLAKAEFAVGHLTELGIGLNGVGNDEEAKNWYLRAAGQGNSKAKERLDEMRRGAPKKQRERLSRHNKAKDDADCVVM